MRFKGWLFDPYLRGKYAVLWFRTIDGRIIKAIDRYHPEFLAEPRGCKPESLCYRLERHPLVRCTEIVKRYTSLRKDVLKSVVRVGVDSLRCLKRVLAFADGLDEVKDTYNKGLTQIQWYLIYKGVAPTSLCSGEVSNGFIKELMRENDDEKIESPPFKTLILKLKDSPKIEGVKAYDGRQRPIEDMRGTEEEVLYDLKELIEVQDPDILVTRALQSTTNDIMRRANCYGMDFRFGRDGKRYHGRIVLGLRAFLDTGIAGLVERARFTLSPMRSCADWESGKNIDSRQCAEAVKQDIMVPDMKGGSREAYTALELVHRDRGGMLFSPTVGLHENVGCLDFESMFPNIIVNQNVSYETVSGEGVDADKPGFMGCFTAPFLERRLRFKHLRDGFHAGSREWLWCQQRQSALKLMLVVIYGYSGCYANRFANVQVFREINRQARDAMVEALNISLDKGFNVIYGDTDSIFTKKLDATEDDYRKLAATISEATELPMGLDRHFRFLVLLNKTSDPQMVATRRYYGKLYSGELFYRGLELRRRDTPPYINDLQTSIIRTLLDADDAHKILNDRLEEAIAVAEEAYNEVLYGSVEANRLVISKKLKKNIDGYESRQPHIVAAMLNRGTPEASYVFVNTERDNHYRRVIPASRIDGEHKVYDRRKYAEMVRRAAWNLLRPFIPQKRIIGGEMLRESRLDTFS